MTTTTAKLIAYHGEQSEKDAILAQLDLHRKADQLVKGRYWEYGKGCAVGCTIHSGNHAEYEPRFGIPEALAWLEDRIFEHLPNEAAMEWPQRFMAAIRPGADLSLVQWQFLAGILTDASITPGIGHPIVKDTVAEIARLCAAWGNGEPVDASAAGNAAAYAAWCAAESAAWRAANAAESAAESAARSAAESAAYAANAAESAARSAAESAAYAANAAESAARSAAYAAYAAESAAWSKMADLLIALLENAP
jgi:hypothetical protein